MNRIRHLAITATALIAAAACAPDASDTEAAAAIRATSNVWFDYYNAGNADGVAALYAEDGIIMAPGRPAVVGRAAIRDYVAADIESANGAGLTFQGNAVTEGSAAGDIAWISGSFSVKHSSGATVDTGKYTTVYRRTNGEWLIIRDVWNSDLQSATGAAKLAMAAAVVDVWNTADYDKLDGIMSTDYRREAPDQNVDSLAEMKALIALIRKTYPDFRITNEGSAASQDAAFVRWTVTGTNTGEGAFPPTGKRVVVPGITMFQFANREIVREFVYFDSASLLAQLGMSVLPNADK